MNIPKDWKERFREQFDHFIGGGHIIGKKGTQFDGCVSDLNDIESFIESERYLAIEEGKEIYRKEALEEKETL
jgi:uncharacterized protein YggL (DUF469 family)